MLISPKGGVSLLGLGDRKACWGLLKLRLAGSEFVGVTLEDKPPTREDKHPNMLDADDGRLGRPLLSELCPDTCEII